MVPINFDQPKERLGAMELVMLGARVLSVCMIYEELLVDGELVRWKEKELNAEDVPRWGLQHYYVVLGYFFLLIFMFLLLYFHMQPSPGDHAFRQLRFSWLSLAQNLGIGLPVHWYVHETGCRMRTA
jgi:hypothetical protein